MKKDLISESESLKLEQAKPHYKSQENSASLPAGSENFMAVKNIADFEIYGIQMATNDGQIMEDSYSAVAAILPTSYYLSANYLNPFNPETNIAFHLPKYARVELSDYNLLGQRVNTLVEGVYYFGENILSAGTAETIKETVSPAVFTSYRIDSEQGSLKRKMVHVT